MSLLVEIRNPRDLTTTYDQIEINRADAQGGAYSVVKADLTIATATASDLSQGYSSWVDPDGDTTKWYKFRYRNGSTYSAYSEEFPGGASVIDTRFRREIRDTNSNAYFFSDADIANFRRDAVFSLWSYTWFEAIDETLTTVANQEKYTFPIGVTRVDDIEFVDSNGTVVGSPKGWRVRARQIIFDVAPPSGFTMRLFVDKMFTKSSEVPEVLEEYLIDYMKLKAYRVLQADRSKFYKYNSVVKSEGGNLPSLAGLVSSLEDSLKERLNRLRRYRKPSDIRKV